MNNDSQCWRVEISGSNIKFIRISDDHQENNIAYSSQTPNSDLCAFEREMVDFQLDCLQVQHRLEVLMDGVEALQGRVDIQEKFMEDLEIMKTQIEDLLKYSSINLGWARRETREHHRGACDQGLGVVDQDALPQPSSESNYPLSLPSALPQL